MRRNRKCKFEKDAKFEFSKLSDRCNLKTLNFVVLIEVCKNFIRKEDSGK